MVIDKANGDGLSVTKAGKKKICLVMGSHWAAMMGGAQYQAKFITEELVKTSRYDVFYVARQVSNSYIPQGYKISQISSATAGRYNSFLFDMFDLAQLLRKINPDVIYQRGMQPYTGVAAYVAQRINCKFIFHIAHDYDVLPFKYKYWPMLDLAKTTVGRIEKSVGEYGLRNANTIIAQTHQQAAMLQANYGRRPDAVISNFHPFPDEEISKPENIVRVVWVANFKITKQPELFVDLAESFQDRKDVEFIMIGRHGDQKIYGPLHNRISQTKNLIYRGELSVEKVNAVLAGAHIFVNTSLAEGFPNTFIQAWMRKVPVVSMGVTVDDTLGGGGMGILAGSFESMKKAVLKLIDNHELRQAMGEHAQRAAFKRYSNKNINELLSFFEV